MKDRANKSSLPSIIQALSQHKASFYADRGVYASIIFKAEKNRLQCLSITIDGSDMACFGLPYFCSKTKETDKGYKIPIKLTGVKVHGWVTACTLFRAMFQLALIQQSSVCTEQSQK